MPRILAPLFAAATYARWLHLLIGMVFAGVVLMVYPGIEEGVGMLRLVTSATVCDSVLLALAALVPAMRRAEGVQARLLLMPDREEDIGVERSRTWADRRRTTAWLIARVALGMAVGLLSVNVMTVTVLLAGAPGRDEPLVLYGQALPVGGDLWYPLFAPLVLFGAGWLVVLAGRLQLAMAVRLLGPSPAERLAEAELRAERLLERNRLARELHDSIGHALTVTVLQAGAAREVGDPAFVAKALEVIEETGRRAMDDLERTLVLLRDTQGGAVTEQPGIEQLPQLFEAARAAGSPVEAWIDVPPGRLPGVLSRETYRIVQEAVTNLLRHAPGEPITVRIAVRDGGLELRCVNATDGGGRSRASGGKGLRGIRERASLLGGEATAARQDDEWVLAVRLPLRLGA
ncbi:signal transduction histidine kinase [Kitasatospora herbaricolor]|uniref:sensor histidine kinase n=1 Tax=Kitasatospora herbaricolor TaxID=68217 RepID=UPI001E521381|nr:histidine kinase [Kitasatospora herbaricolor]MDQ0311631.1 signal transduction histidine kinase [Kitasatospora herbaricolor]